MMRPLGHEAALCIVLCPSIRPSVPLTFPADEAGPHNSAR